MYQSMYVTIDQSSIITKFHPSADTSYGISVDVLVYHKIPP